MLTPRSTLARRVTAALDASPSRIPVLARRLRQRTNDACCSSCANASAAPRSSTSTSSGPRRRRSGSCARSRRRRRSRSATRRRARPAPARRSTRRSPFSAAPGPPASEPATFLLDEFLELRTFESFPGLRRVLHDCIDGLAASGNRFVLTSRYVARALRLLRDRSARFEVIHMPPLTAEDTLDILGPTAAPAAATTRTTPTISRARSRRSPTAGRPTSARSPTSSRRCASTAVPAAATPSARSPALLAPEGRLAEQCELLLRAAPAPRARLRRAQGDSRDPRGRGRADAHRDLAAPAAHAGLDEGLSVVARGRRPGHVAAEALQLHRSAAARLGAPALPRRRRRPTTISRAKCTATRCRACRSRPSRRRRRRRPSRRSRWPAARLGDHRDRLGEIGELVNW